MTKLPLVVVLATSSVTAGVAHAADDGAAPPSFWSQPAAYAGLAAVAAGAVGVGFGALRVSQNGDRAGERDFYRTGPAGFLYMGAGVATAMAGALAMDWARLAPSARDTHSYHTRRWAFAAIGLGALAAGAGAALITDTHNDARRDGVPEPGLGAARLVGWPAIVLGSAAAVIGIEGLMIDAFSTSAETGRATSHAVVSWRGRF